MCELTQAGGQNNPKNTAERKRVDLFHYLANWRIPKQHTGSRDAPVGMPAPSGTVRLSPVLAGSRAAVCNHSSRAHAQGVCQHAVTSSVPLMTSELWALSQDRELKYVHERAFKSL